MESCLGRWKLSQHKNILQWDDYLGNQTPLKHLSLVCITVALRLKGFILPTIGCQHPLSWYKHNKVAALQNCWFPWRCNVTCPCPLKGHRKSDQFTTKYQRVIRKGNITGALRHCAKRQISKSPWQKVVISPMSLQKLSSYPTLQKSSMTWRMVSYALTWFCPKKS